MSQARRPVAAEGTTEDAGARAIEIRLRREPIEHGQELAFSPGRATDWRRLFFGCSSGIRCI